MSSNKKSSRKSCKIVSSSNEVPSVGSFEKKPDNPVFAHEKQNHQSYMNFLEQKAMEMAIKDPRKYQKCQIIGDSHMNVSYDLVSGIDTEGDEVKAKIILDTITNYGLAIDDLSELEIQLLDRTYKNDWKKSLD